MKRILWAVICLMMVCATFSGCASEKAEIVIPEISIAPAKEVTNESLEFVRGIRVGWNLGNTFDANGDYLNGKNHMSAETSWVGVKTSQAMIDAVRAAGFNAIRVPISWHNHVDGDFAIAKEWLDRVQEVVDYAYNQDMYVIINIHHDCMKGYFYPTNDEFETSKRYVEAIWSQLCERFGDYGEKLIFELINEPRLTGTAYEWWLDMTKDECKEAVGCLNRLSQFFVDTVRATGGNNADRYLMITPYDAGYTNAVNMNFILPKDTADNKLIVSVHAYIPYLYALAGTDVKDSTDVFDLAQTSSYSEINTMMNSLYNRFIVSGVPVIMGEFGASGREDMAEGRGPLQGNGEVPLEDARQDLVDRPRQLRRGRRLRDPGDRMGDIGEPDARGILPTGLLR